MKDNAIQPPASGDPNFADMVEAFLEVEDPRAVVVQNALYRAITEDLDLTQALGVRGSLKAAYWLQARNSVLSSGAELVGGIGTFVEAYRHWKRSRAVHDERLRALFEDLETIEPYCALPGSESQLRRVVAK